MKKIILSLYPLAAAATRSAQTFIPIWEKGKMPNSRGLSLRQHQAFESTEKAIEENQDIASTVDVFETIEKRMMVGDTDEGRKLAANAEDLKLLVQAYQRGLVKEKQ